MAAGNVCQLCGCGHFVGDPCMEGCAIDRCVNARAPTETVEQECDHDWEFIGGLANSEGLNGVCRKCRARHHDRETVEHGNDVASSLVTHPQTCPWCKGDGGPCVHCGVEQEEDDCRHAYICQKCGGGRFYDPEDAVKWLSDGEDDIVVRLRWWLRYFNDETDKWEDPHPHYRGNAPGFDETAIEADLRDALTEIAHLRSVCDGARQQEQEWAALTDRAIALIRRLRRSAPREFGIPPQEERDPETAAAMAKVFVDRSKKIEAPREVVGWQPIETAPRDGTDVLVWDPEWDEHPTIAGYDSMYGKWADEGFDPNSPWAPEPTHWMPLPDPPVGPPTGDEEGQE